jgi:membrane-associated protease RseP (regulator of RpoE activity)
MQKDAEQKDSKEKITNEENSKKDRDGLEQILKTSRKIREFAKNIKPKDKNIENLITLFLIIISFFSFWYLIDLPIWIVLKIFLVFVILFVSGEILIGLKNLEGDFGLIFFKDKRIIDWIDKTSKKYKNEFLFLADIGLIIGYGVFGVKMLEKKVKKTTILFGFLILFLFSILILPYTYKAAILTISSNEIGSASSYLQKNKILEFDFEIQINSNKFTINLFGVLVYLITLFFGLAGMILVSLIVYSTIVLIALITKIAQIILAFIGLKELIAPQIPPPGGTLLLPGKNLPLIEGLIAFVMILVVHELFHGFLARIYNIKIQSTGLVLFGVLPIGAFVEPDEEEVLKLPKEKQNKILIAGSAGNIYLAIICFFLFTLIIFLTSGLRIEAIEVIGQGIEKNTYLYNIYTTEGEVLDALNLSIKPNQTIFLNTSTGVYKKTYNKDANLDFALKKYYKNAFGFSYKYLPAFSFIELILNTLLLTFALNVMVGSINLLFLPFFDGNRLLKNLLDKQEHFEFVVILTTVAFLINLLPWFFI